MCGFLFLTTVGSSPLRETAAWQSFFYYTPLRVTSYALRELNPFQPFQNRPGDDAAGG